MRIGYARVSSKQQNLARQLEALHAEGCERIHEEKESGKDRTRPELEGLIQYLRPGDEVITISLDRLSRSVVDAHGIISDIRGQGATLRLLKENLTIKPDGTDPMANLIVNMFAILAEFERENIRSRQAEGIAIAKEAGAYAKPRKMTARTTAEVRRLHELGIPKADIARRLGVSRASVYRALADAETQQA